jgi:TPR repeat protein
MRILFIVIVFTVLAAPAGAQDFKTGLAAYDRGDFAAALKEWRPLAERGDARAQYNLGVVLFNGQGVAHDPVKAVEWYRAAADQGYGPAQANLSFMYEPGQGLLQNYLEAYTWSTLAARHGVNARRTLDSLAAKMTPAQIADAEQAAAVWNPRLSENAPPLPAAANSDAVDAARANAASNGPGREKVREAQTLLNALGFSAGGADGIAGRQTRAAVREYQGKNDLPVTGMIDDELLAQLTAAQEAAKSAPVVEAADTKEADKPAIEEEEIAARAPEDTAPTSPEPALTPNPPPAPAAKAPPAETPPAEIPPVRAQDCDQLAAHPADVLRPKEVPGVPFGDIDADRAVPACEAALALNGDDMRLQLQLARSLHKAERLDEAVVYYQQAGLQGHPLAQKTLGFAYANGLGVTQDFAKTAQWHQLAAEQGDRDAQHNLGYLYAAGQGVEQDLVQAHMWYNIAAAHESPGAAESRDVLAARMTDEQIEEAERRALAWFDIHFETLELR